MNTLILEREPLAASVEVTKSDLVVRLTDGRTLTVPLHWYPRLTHASVDERHNWRLLGDGYAIEWPDLDEHIGVEGLFAGRPSGESERSFQRWIAERNAASTV